MSEADKKAQTSSGERTADKVNASPQEKAEKKARKRASAASPAPDEAAINAPDKPTLIMLSVICLTTLIMWAAGRAACNYSVPGESLTPRTVSLEERTATPKGVGLELSQALLGGDFETAEKLVRGPALDQVKKEQASCGNCAEREARRSGLLSVSTVLRATSIDSIVSVETTQDTGEPVVRLYRIERDGRIWRATGLLEDAEGITLKTPPPRSRAPASLRRPEADAMSSFRSTESIPAPKNPGPMLKGRPGKGVEKSAPQRASTPEAEN